MTADATYPFGLYASIMCSSLVCLVSLLCHIPKYPVLCTSMYFYNTKLCLRELTLALQYFICTGTIFTWFIDAIAYRQNGATSNACFASAYKRSSTKECGISATLTRTRCVRN